MGLGGREPPQVKNHNKYNKTPTNYFASSDPHQLGLQLSRMCCVICILHLGRPSGRPGPPGVGDMWYRLHLGRPSGRPEAPAVGDMWCHLHLLSVSVLYTCLRGGPLGDLGLQLWGYVLSFAFVVCICSIRLFERRPSGRPLADLRLQLSGVCGVIYICRLYLFHISVCGAAAGRPGAPAVGDMLCHFPPFRLELLDLSSSSSSPSPFLLLLLFLLPLRPTCK